MRAFLVTTGISCVALVTALGCGDSSSSGAGGATSTTSGTTVTGTTAGATGNTSSASSTAASTGSGSGCMGAHCPELLANDSKGPAFLDTDGTHVFWTNYEGEIRSVPVQGGAVQLIATDPGQTSHNDPIRVHGNDVWWMGTASDIKHMPTAGGAIVTVDPGGLYGDGIDLVVDGTNVYANTSANSGVHQVPIGGGAAVDYLNDPANPPGGIAVSGGYVIAVMTGSAADALVKVPIGGGAPTVLAHHTSLSQGYVVTDADNAYWTETTAIPPAVRKVALTGGVVTELVTSGQPGSLAVDASYVYYTDGSDGGVHRVPIAGGANEVLATLTDGAGRLALDASSIYVCGGASIWRIAK